MENINKKILQEIYHIFENKSWDDLINGYLDYKDEYGDNILMIACKKNAHWTKVQCADAIKFLLESNSVSKQIVNHRNVWGQTPLMCSIEWTPPSITKHILESNKFDKNSLQHVDTRGDTPLMIAVKSGNAPVVKYLLDSNFLTYDDLLFEDSSARSVLFHACSHVEIMKYILESDIATQQVMNHVDNYGFTPLMSCTFKNCSNIIPMIESGKCIFPMITSEVHWHSIMCFIGFKSPSTLKYLLDNNYLNTSHIEDKNVSGKTLMMDVCRSNPESVKIILESGKCTSRCLEMTDLEGSTPLIIACEYQPLAVEYLLNSNLLSERAICAVNKYGNTCLSCACRHNDSVVVQLLNSNKVPRSMIETTKKMNYEKCKFTPKAIGCLSNYRTT